MNSRDLADQVGPGGVPPQGQSIDPLWRDRLQAAFDAALQTADAAAAGRQAPPAEPLVDLDTDRVPILAAGLQAARERTRLTPLAGPPVVCVSGQVGLANLPWMVLIAWLLCDHGVQAVITGSRGANGHVHAGEVLDVMGVQAVQRPGDVSAVAGRGEPIFLELGGINAALHGWMRDSATDVRGQLARVIAPLLDPVLPPARSHVLLTDDHGLARSWIALTREGGFNALIIDLDRPATHPQPQSVLVCRGEGRVLVPRSSWPAALSIAPELPDAVGIARWVQAVLAGELPVPDAIAQLVEQLVALTTDTPGHEDNPAREG